MYVQQEARLITVDWRCTLQMYLLTYSTSSQLTVQNSMKSTLERTILMGKIENTASPDHTPSWPPVARSPITNWAPPHLSLTSCTDRSHDRTPHYNGKNSFISENKAAASVGLKAWPVKVHLSNYSVSCKRPFSRAHWSIHGNNRLIVNIVFMHCFVHHCLDVLWTIRRHHLYNLAFFRRLILYSFLNIDCTFRLII